jgi:hypothetical protein
MRVATSFATVAGAPAFGRSAPEGPYLVSEFFTLLSGRRTA